METKNKKQELQVSKVAEDLNNAVTSVLGDETLHGFNKAYAVASAIKEIKNLLTPEYMKPIMELQGNKLGFKTDKDKEGGYSEAIVKNCLIEAVLFGLQPCGNQFNIIAGNTYATKEGVGYLLSKIKGLHYDIVAELPRVKDTSSAVVMNITWTINGVTQTKKLDIPVKVNNYMGTDAILGKAVRKSRKWLYDTLMGCDLPEADVIDIDSLQSRKASTTSAMETKEAETIIVEDREATTIVSEATDLFNAK